MTFRFLVLGGELRRAQQKALRFFQLFKPIKPDLGLKSALALVNGAVTDATVHPSRHDGGLHRAAADLAMGATFSASLAWPRGATEGQNPLEF